MIYCTGPEGKLCVFAAFCFRLGGLAPKHGVFPKSHPHSKHGAPHNSHNTQGNTYKQSNGYHPNSTNPHNPSSHPSHAATAANGHAQGSYSQGQGHHPDHGKGHHPGVAKGHHPGGGQGHHPGVAQGQHPGGGQGHHTGGGQGQYHGGGQVSSIHLTNKPHSNQPGESQPPYSASPVPYGNTVSPHPNTQRLRMTQDGYRQVLSATPPQSADNSPQTKRAAKYTNETSEDSGISEMGDQDRRKAG